jgi:hypothetical protein
MVAGANFGNAPPGVAGGTFHVFGKQNGNLPPPAPNGYPDNRYMTLIGFRSGNDWRMYAQLRDPSRALAAAALHFTL